MLKKLDGLKGRFNELTKMISDPDVVKDQKQYKSVMQEYTHLATIMEARDNYEQLLSKLADAKEMLENESDPEMKEMAREEASELLDSVETMEQKIHLLMVPKDPLDGKNIIMEIRAGTGGDEAALFASDLYRMYNRYADTKGWKVEIMGRKDPYLCHYSSGTTRSGRNRSKHQK